MKRMTTIAAAALAVTLVGPVMAQDIQEAADNSEVENNMSKGVANGSPLTTAISGASPLQLRIVSTGYFGGKILTDGNEHEHVQQEGGGGGSAIIGTLGLGSSGCPFVNAHRRESTYTPGESFTVRNCGYISNFWVGVRVYGMICSATDRSNCQRLEDGITDPGQYETGGYVALLKPGRECSQEKWPTEALRRAGAPAYAEWCDYGVRVP